MTYADPAKQREYQRQWKARRRAAYFEDKVCAHCDSTEDLELDHIDPSDKGDHNIWSWTESRRVAELAKCQVLCRGCHQDKSVQFDSPRASHGSPGMYSLHKCRCEECRDWKRRSNAEFRSKG